jgi:uncharacterized cupin superfamily protein
MVPEAQLEQTAEGLVAKTDGWFVLNAREARWYHAEGRSAFCDFEGGLDFAQLGINVSVLGPGEPMAMYHWEADQEDFLVVAGEAVLIVEGEERPLRQWDFVHCPPKTEHVVVGAGEGPCVLVAMSSRQNQAFGPYGEYTANEVARRHGASPAETTQDGDVADAAANWPESQPTRYRDGWLPGA